MVSVLGSGLVLVVDFFLRMVGFTLCYGSV